MSIYRLFIPVVFIAMLGGCSETCANRVVSVSLVNETDDTIYMEMLNYSWAPYKYNEEYQLEEVLPNAQAFRTDVRTDDIDMAGWHVWIAKKSSIDQYGMDSVINAQLYDTVLHYNLDHLEANDFIIKIQKDQRGRFF